MQEYIEFCDSLRRAFAMTTLAMLSNVSRDDIVERASKVGVRVTAIPVELRDKLRLCVARGDVTCIVPSPEPFAWLVIKTAHEELRTTYGIWVGRPASWRGKVDPNTLPHLNTMTVAEAEAKGIPMPAMKE